MAIECKNQNTTIEDVEINALCDVLNDIPGIDITIDRLKVLLGISQVDMCETSCAANGCAVRRFNKETVRNVIVDYVGDVIIKGSGINN